MTERKESFEIPQYGYEIEVVITDNIEKSRSAYDDYLGSGLRWDGEEVAGLHSCNKKQPKSILFFDPSSTYEVVAHEAFHCVSRMYRYYDTKLTKSTEEIYAYTMGYVVDKCHQVINKR